MAGTVEPYGEVSKPDVAEVFGDAGLVSFQVEDFDTVESLGKEFQEGADDEAGMRGAEAEVRAKAESDVRVGLAVEEDLLGVAKGAFVEIGGSEAEGNALAGFDRGAVDFGFAGGGASDVGNWREDAQQFFASEGNEPGIVAQNPEGIGLFGEVSNGAGDGVDDGVAPAGEHEIGEAGNFIAREQAALKG